MKKLWSIKNVSQDRVKELVIAFYLMSLLIIGLLLQTPRELFNGLFNIFKSPGILFTDYMVIGGIGVALVNASMVGIIGFIIIKVNKVLFNGPSIAALFIMCGYGLFGKNIWSILPVILGVYIFSKIKRQSFKTYIYPALFGTALAPIVTQVAFGFGWGILSGIIVGILSGIVIPSLSIHLLKTHEGYNLYNVGFAAGFVGLLFLSIFKNYGFNSEIILIWGTNFDSILRLIILPMFLSMVLLGIIINKGRLKDYPKLLKHPGTLVTDFVTIGGLGNTLINMGLVGLIGLSYIELVGGNYNGPTVGALITIVGFAAFGVHPFNMVPIMLGVWLGTHFSAFQGDTPVVILAVLFSTCLAPLSGQFGPIIGILVGFVHYNISVVANVGYLHGGMNLYNNGFAAGIVAIIFVALIKAFKGGEENYFKIRE